MAGVILVDDLINQVRAMLDEQNQESVSDTDDILPALNRAQDYASNILARHYEDPLLTKVQIEPISSQMEYQIPEDAFERRVEKIEARVNEQYYPLTRISYRDISLYENRKSSAIPYYYVVVGDRIRIVPTGNASYPLRVWYLKDPLPLVKNQGRINVVNSGSNYIVVDTPGDDLTTEADQLESYVNVIDNMTGERKATFQVKNINNNKITFKTSPARTSVLNIGIDTDMTALLQNETAGVESPEISIDPDDHISIIKGSCVPFFKKPFSNFLIQYAIAEIRRKLGGPAELEQRVLKELEEQVERSWVGREHTLRVKKSNDAWALPVRRYYGTRNS